MIFDKRIEILVVVLWGIMNVEDHLPTRIYIAWNVR